MKYSKQTSEEFWQTTQKQHSEITLWREFKAGDESAYIIIYQKYFRQLYRYGLKVCGDPEIVKDCIQDLFIDLWTRRSHLSHTDSITFYLWASLKRRIVKAIPRDDHPGRDPSDLLVQAGDKDAEETIIMEEIAMEQRGRIAKAMHLLSKRQREAVQLKYYDNLNNEEIARKMSIQVDAVYNLISKALSLFRKALTVFILIGILQIMR